MPGEVLNPPSVRMSNTFVATGLPSRSTTETTMLAGDGGVCDSSWPRSPSGLPSRILRISSSASGWIARTIET